MRFFSRQPRSLDCVLTNPVIGSDIVTVVFCFIVLSNLVELLPSGSLHPGEIVEPEAKVSKERLEVFLTASEAPWELQNGGSWSVPSDWQVC